MPSNPQGHTQNKEMKDVPIDEELWRECLAVVPHGDIWRGDLPKFWGIVDGDIKVFVVDANRIMVEHDMDFCQGGNGVEDPDLCGKKEIYLDNRVILKDLPFDCYHEAFERRAMLAGDNYDKAHDKANAQEITLRRRAMR